MIKQKRKSPRLKNYDYTQAGAYFVTICSKDRECIFGEIKDGTMVSNEYGDAVQFTWDDLIQHNANISLDQFVVMPNHIHGIIFIKNNVGAGSKPAQIKPAPITKIDSTNDVVNINNKRAGLEPAPTNHGLPEIVRQFKTFSTKRVNKIQNKRLGNALWQRNYYEHIIRDTEDLNRIREYISNNPTNWDTDKNNITALALGGK